MVPGFYTDIQLKSLSRRVEVFYMKIIMRRDFMIFQSENHKIDSADRRCLSNLTEMVQFENSITSSQF